jgi:methionine aminotransferase
MTRLANEHGAINLSQGFPDFDCSPELVETVARYMREGHNQYAPMPGVAPLRAALAMKIERLYGRRYNPENEITITSGATAALFSTLTAFVRPGDEVVLFQPCYDSYVPVVQLNGGIPKFVTLRFPDYRIDWDEVRRAVTPRTRLLVINSPHNPTGMVLTPADIRELKRVLEGTDALVVSDEVYEHIIFDGEQHESIARDPDLAARSVVVSSFGKSYHTTGWKVGYTAAPEVLTREIQRVHQFVTFTVNGAIQMAYAEMVNRDPLCTGLSEFYQAKRDLFLSLTAGSHFKPLACRGTYFQLLDYSAFHLRQGSGGQVTGDRDNDMALRLLKEHGVASIPTSAFLYGEEPGPVLRFCFAKRDETLERAAARLREV